MDYRGIIHTGFAIVWFVVAQYFYKKKSPLAFWGSTIIAFNWLTTL
jgi:hypothetical protein